MREGSEETTAAGQGVEPAEGARNRPDESGEVAEIVEQRIDVVKPGETGRGEPGEVVDYVEKTIEITGQDDLNSPSVTTASEPAEDCYEAAVSGHFARVDTPGRVRRMTPDWISERVFDDAHEWEDLWHRYEGFAEDIEDLLFSYGRDVTPAEPHMDVSMYDERVEITSREEAVSIEQTQDVYPRTHTWRWKPTEDISFEIAYQDGTWNNGVNAYVQSGAEMTVDDVPQNLVDELVDRMEVWFGESSSYKSPPNLCY